MASKSDVCNAWVELERTIYNSKGLSALQIFKIFCVLCLPVAVPTVVPSAVTCEPPRAKQPMPCSFPCSLSGSIHLLNPPVTLPVPRGPSDGPSLYYVLLALEIVLLLVLLWFLLLICLYELWRPLKPEPVNPQQDQIDG